MYLQYDGEREETHRALRGTDLRANKRRAIERLSEARVFTTLVATVSEVNAGEIGAILDTAFGTPYVGGVMFQPLFASGRAPALDPMRRVTTTGVLRRIEQQTAGRIAAHDLIALPVQPPGLLFDRVFSGRRERRVPFARRDRRRGRAENPA